MIRGLQEASPPGCSLVSLRLGTVSLGCYCILFPHVPAQQRCEEGTVAHDDNALPQDMHRRLQEWHSEKRRQPNRKPEPVAEIAYI